MITTVVGSYPIQPARDVLARQYLDGFDAADPYLPCISETVTEMASCGVQLVGDGQTRNNMINLFTDRLAGIRSHQRPVVVGEIRHTSPITLSDLSYAKRSLQEGVKIKGIITGPTTLARSVVDRHYVDEGELIMAFARAMAAEARAIRAEVPLIQVDEPFLSAGISAASRDAIAEIRRAVDVPISMHVCGDVSGVFAELAEFPVDVLDHEFCAHPGLFDVVREHPTGKSLGVGCVRSDDDRVETVPEIRATLERAASLVGQDRMYADPDCGLRHRARASARDKLKNMCQAARELERDGR